MTNYRVYLSKEYGFSDADIVLCEDLDQVEELLANAEEYERYIVVKHDIEINQDTSFDFGDIQKPINYRKKNKGLCK